MSPVCLQRPILSLQASRLSASAKQRSNICRAYAGIEQSVGMANASVATVAATGHHSTQLGALGVLSMGSALLVWKRCSSQTAQCPPSSVVPGEEPAKTVAEPTEVDARLPEVAVTPDIVVVEVDNAMLESREQTTSRTMSKAESSLAAGIESRHAAKALLKEALESKDLAQLQAALAAAEASSLGRCPEGELAQSLVAPSMLLKEATLSRDLDSSRVEPRDGSTAEAAEAELLVTADMSEEQLRARVVELSRSVAAARLYPKARLEEALATNLEAAELRSLECLESGLISLKADVLEKASKESDELDAKLRDQLPITVAARAESVSVETEENLVATESARLQAFEEMQAYLKVVNVDDVFSVSNGLQSMEQALDREKDSVERHHACRGLAQAVAALEDAILAGRPCNGELQTLRLVASKADTFVDGLMTKLPEECTSICRDGAVPTEESIRKTLPDQLHELTTTAFLPPGGGLAAELVARLFRSLYFVNCEPSATTSEEDDRAKEVRKNLAAISRLSRAAKPCELEDALLCFEDALTGSCVEATQDWLSATRSALLLRQTLWAAKARMHCLIATSE